MIATDHELVNRWVTVPPKVIMVDTGKLKKIEFNPPPRTEEARIKDLVDAIVEARCILQPLLITRDYWIGDGNRRHAAASKLDIPAVPCIVSDMALQLLFRLANSGRMHITNAQWAAILARGFSIENLPVAQQKVARKIREVVSAEEYEEIIKSGKSLNNLHTYGRAFANLCGDKSLIGPAIVWIVRQPSYVNIRQLASGMDVAPTDLHSKIVSGQPLATIDWGQRNGNAPVALAQMEGG